MKYASTHSITLINGLSAQSVQVETSIRRGIPAFQISGLSGSSIKQTGDRIRSAIQSTTIRFPVATIVVNLSPVDIPKKGALFDLAIAASILKATGDFQPDSVLGRMEPESTLYLGELSLSGEVFANDSILPYLFLAKERGFRHAVVPAGLDPKTDAISEIEVIPIRNLNDLVGGDYHPPPSAHRESIPSYDAAEEWKSSVKLNMHSLILPDRIRKGAFVAATGWHPTLLVGPPGSGKSSLASDISHLMPPVTEDEALELTIVQSYLDRGAEHGGRFKPGRPSRSPHHTVTGKALIGGGSPPSPGEITRSHLGALVLDEYAEFDRNTLQALREPIETGSITLSRSNKTARFPARFLLIATSNPCACGHAGSVQTGHRCTCTPAMLKSYRSRLFGPLRDRIDLEILFSDHSQVFSNRLSLDELFLSQKCAIQRQANRYKNHPFRFNGQVPLEATERLIPVSLEIRNLLADFKNNSFSSFRVIRNIRRIARTIADLDDAEDISAVHLQEAFSYRMLDSLLAITDL